MVYLVPVSISGNVISHSCRARDGLSGSVIRHSCRARDGLSGSVIRHSCRVRDGFQLSVVKPLILTNWTTQPISNRSKPKNQNQRTVA